VAQATDYTPEALNRYFEATLAAGKVDADRLVRTQGARVLELFAGRSGLDTLGKQFLAQLPADLLHNHTVLGFLSQLREQANLSEELRTRLAAVQTLRDYLDQPQFEVERLQGVTAALAVTPPAVPASTKGEIFAAVATELKRRADSPELQADLETVLVHFGSTLATDSTDLYENLLRDLRTRTELARHPKLIEAFLALALGAAHSEDLAGKLDGLDGHAFAVATDAAKRGGNRLLNLLDGRAKEWPKEPRTKWGFLLTAVRPQGFKRTLRDGGFLLAGAAAASLAWWVASLLQ
jgi:hypothetical protein